MANYEIHIQDVENIEDELILHYAERDAIELNWLGGDSKTQAIVGSELNFSLEASDARDAAFIELFTLDEKRWLVTLRISESQELVWQGYILPESYQEPYNSAIFYVQFSSVDGLGLLKGVKLPDDFYNDEKSVMQVLCKILKLTKVDLEIFFSPAIVNSNEKDWNKLLVDTQLWDKNKDNAYKLLKDLLESMRCQVYQCEGRWYIEGFNKRQLLKVTYEVYDLDGNYLRTQEVEKTIKQIPYLATPDVRMVPGIREAVVTYERNPLEFPEDIIQENDVPWVVYPGQVDNYWYPQNWNYTISSIPYILTVDRELVYFNQFNLSELYTSRFITTRKKLFVKKNSTIKIKIELKVLEYESLSDSDKTDAVVNGWSSLQIFEVRLNNNIIITNLNANEQNQGYLVYNNGRAEVELTIRPENDGLLDFKFFEPFGSFSQTKYKGTHFKEFTIEVVPEVEDELYVIENTEQGSNISELGIRFGDDPILFTEAFYLEPTRELVGLSQPNRFWFEVNYYQTKNGIIYALVPLRAAVMAYRLRFETNKIYHVNGSTAVTGQVLNNPEIIFNFEDGESAAIVVNEELASGHILCNFSKLKEETVNRVDNTQWSDAISQVQRKRFGQVVGEIEKRIYESPHFSLEGSTDTPLKYNDIIKFKYFGENRYFTLSNCSWRPDSNTSDILMNEMLYEGASSEILPPFVDAGPDIVLGENDLATFLSAVASAPSGFIETIQWTRVAGGTTPIIDEPNNLQTLVEDVRDDFYTFRITVTDSNGLTAFDEVDVVREGESDLELNLVDSISEAGENNTDPNINEGDFVEKYRKYEILFNPPLGNNASVSIVFDIFLKLMSNTFGNIFGNAEIQIKKNGTLIFGYRITQADMTQSELTENYNDVAFSISNQDNVTLEIYAFAQDFNNAPVTSVSRIIFKTATVTGENRVINGLPIVEELTAQTNI